MSVWSSVASAISDATLCSFNLTKTIPVGGGSINHTYRLLGKDRSSYFLKLNHARHHPMFIAEIAGLKAIAATGTIRLPQPVAHGIANEQSFLVLEHLELHTRGNSKMLGEKLALLHRCTAPQFGFVQDNFIGTTPQSNSWADDWLAFWREQRLGFQLQLAAEKGYAAELQDLGERLLDTLPAFFAGYTPRPSLLHGDLWGGNHAYLAKGTPVLFDPASYYGDRECDLAMTELFGGYPADFYDSYRGAWRLDAGYALRRDLYNFYHILNHANLFGGGYIRQARQTMRELLSSVGK